MSRSQVRKVREYGFLALLLAGVGGSVDAIGYMVLWHMFTAHMSGNSIAMAIHVGQQDWAKAFHRAFPIPLYVVGVALGAAVGEIFNRRGCRFSFSVAMGIEAVLLLVFLLGGNPVFQDGEIWPGSDWTFYLLAALPALAMGMQNASLRRVGNATVRTTYITGMLTNLAEETVAYLFWLRDHWFGGKRLGLLLRLSLRNPPFNRMFLQLAIWVAYVLGAVLGAVAKLQWGLLSLAGPIGGLVLIALIGIVQPIQAQTMPR